MVDVRQYDKSSLACEAFLGLLPSTLLLPVAGTGLLFGLLDIGADLEGGFWISGSFLLAFGGFTGTLSILFCIIQG